MAFQWEMLFLHEWMVVNYGVHTFPVGSTFSGMWKDGLIKEGSQGVYQFVHDQYKVSGIWHQVLYLPIDNYEHPQDGFYYSGMMCQDSNDDWIITGNGTLYNNKKKKLYHGEFLNGAFHGYGARFDGKRTIQENGLWKYGKLTSTSH